MKMGYLKFVSRQQVKKFFFTAEIKRMKVKKIPVQASAFKMLKDDSNFFIPANMHSI